jgi:hypothetical protein
MVAKSSKDESPDFSTLTGIMDYFNKVPFETFKNALNEWFTRELPLRRPDLIKPNGEIDLPPDLFNFIDKLFIITEEKDQSRLN